MMGKHVFSKKTGFFSGQNLSLAGQMTCLLTKIAGLACTCNLLFWSDKLWSHYVHVSMHYVIVHTKNGHCFNFYIFRVKVCCLREL